MSQFEMDDYSEQDRNSGYIPKSQVKEVLRGLNVSGSRRDLLVA
jgi:hypothetical protein